MSPYVSMGLNMVPGVGAVKGFLELSTGRDLVTGQWHNRSDADLVFQVIATSIIPTPAQPTYSWTPSYVLRTRAAGAAKTGLNPAEINFSQRTVSANVRQYADDMAAGNWDWSRSGPLRVMERDGQWVSYDNRRLMAAQQAGLGEVPVQVVQPGALMPGSSLTWEQAFTRRFSDPRNVQAGGVVPNPGLPTQPSIAPPRR